MADHTLNYGRTSVGVMDHPTNALNPVEQAQTQYTALLETSLLLSRAIDYNDLLQTFLQKMLDVSGMDYAVMLLDEGGVPQFIGGRDSAQNILSEDPLKLSDDLLVQIYRHRDTVFIPDASTFRYTNGHALGSLLVFPMLRGEMMLGVVHLSGQVALPDPDPLLIPILKAMAAQLGLATDNAIAVNEIAQMSANLETEVQERTDQLSQANSWLAENLRQVEDKLNALTEMDKRRSRFFSALSHELRSPIQLLIGHAYMITEEGLDRLTESQQSSLNVIMKTCEHVRSLTTKVLDAGKLDEGGMSIEPTPLDVRPLIDDCLESIRGVVQNKAIQLVHAYPPDLPLVAADEMRVRQILLNLLGNASRYTEEGQISVSAIEHKGFVVIKVEDTGAGISEDKLEAVFDPYVQADSLRAHSGTGLGLSISKQLVELHGGQIGVKSVIGKGSSFFFSLPIVIS